MSPPVAGTSGSGVLRGAPVEPRATSSSCSLKFFLGNTMYRVMFPVKLYRELRDFAVGDHTQTKS
jgi:hypothetical protein